MPDTVPVPAVRACTACGEPEGMKLHNFGIFTAHYVCSRCGITLTVPPETLIIPPKHFNPED